MSKKELTDQIQHIHETDAGDFKRKAGLYLNRFAKAQADQRLKRAAQSLRDNILYKELTGADEAEDIDHLRFAILEELKKL